MQCGTNTFFLLLLFFNKQWSCYQSELTHGSAVTRYMFGIVWCERITGEVPQQDFLYEDPDGSSGEEANSEKSSQEEEEPEMIALVEYGRIIG